MICVAILELGGYLQYDGYDYSPNSRRFKWEGDATSFSMREFPLE